MGRVSRSLGKRPGRLGIPVSFNIPTSTFSWDWWPKKRLLICRKGLIMLNCLACLLFGMGKKKSLESSSALCEMIYNLGFVYIYKGIFPLKYRKVPASCTLSRMGSYQADIRM